jgi:hypothetical protein
VAGPVTQTPAIPANGTYLHVSLASSVTVDFDDSLGEGLRGFLGQIVTDAATDKSMRISARGFLGLLAILCG